MGRRKQQPSTFGFKEFSASASDHVHYHVEDGVTLSTPLNVAPHKRARVEEVEDEGDHYGHDALNMAYGAADAELAAVADTLTAHDDAADPEDDIYEYQIPAEGNGKRPRFPNADDPMRVWREQRDIILDNLMRHDGLGTDTAHPACFFCRAEYEQGKTRVFRCQECGVFLQCLSCLEQKHEVQPLHVIQEWNDEFWIRAALHRIDLKDDSAQSLRMRFQLGHQGRACPLPTNPHRLVVMDTNGIFTLDVKACGCSRSLSQNLVAQLQAMSWYPATTSEMGTCATFRCLELYRTLNVVGSLNAHDFVGSLERLTDPTSLGKTPDRYKAFGRMARQYASLKRVKRAGLAHRPQGWNAAEGEASKVEAGACAVRCWACPCANFNLPRGWDTCKPEDEFLYALLLALDANFRLKNRIRANERHDRATCPGWGCFVDDGPYKEHLQDYVAEEDISTCIAFAALMQKETKVTTGLRCVPRASATCRRAKRYANMDYIFMHAIRDARVKRLVVSYDVVCQWKVYLRTRVLKILEDSTIPTDLDKFDIQFALPVWHAAAHEEECQMANSLSYTRGVGRTDGEGIERTWAVLNTMSYATKEMSLPNRLDSLEDKVDRINFEKNVGEGDALPRKLVIAVAERDKQIAEFVEVDSSLDPAVRREWLQQVRDWEADKTKPNPYVVAGGKSAGPSEAQVAAALKAAEVKEAREGQGEFVDGKMTATGVHKGLIAARKLENELKGSTTLTADRASQIDELRASFFKKLKAIRAQQDVFMPGVAALRAAAEELRDPDRPAPKAEDTKLWLPSDLRPTERRAMRRGLAAIEGQLREAQCGDALGEMRCLLYQKTHLVHHRNANVTGQRASTRSGTIIGRVSDHISREVTKYRQAWRSLRTLLGDDYAPELRELLDGDVSVFGEQESDAGARLRLGARRARRGAQRNEPSASTSEPRAVSWIWWAAVRDGDQDAQLHDVRWAKTRARRDRWIEEVRLLREEMRRVLRSLRSVQKEWRTRIECGRAVDMELEAGLRAYAKRQVAIHQWIAAQFVQSWTQSPSAAVAAVLREDAKVYERLLVGDSENEEDDDVGTWPDDTRRVPMLDRITDEMLAVDQETKAHWDHQRLGKQAHVVPNDSVFFRRPTNHTVLAALVTSAITSHIYQLPHRGAKILLAGVQDVLSTIPNFEEHARDIPRDPQTIVNMLN
ncbi:CxC2 domain-containing protein [Mycena kentingensis (nom. inval.)]|nr:CxC2 domain-containing protein [Mycena kentingensis (nom. inval.)]